MRVPRFLVLLPLILAGQSVAAPFLELIETHQGEARREVEGMAISPDGAHAYVAVDGGDTVAIFERDATSGALTFVAFEEDGGNGILFPNNGKTTISPDGAHVYVSDPNGDSVTAFARDPGTGLLDLVEFEQTGVGGVTDLDRPRDLVVTPDGAHVYVIAMDGDALVVFARDVSTGSLTFVEAEVDGVDGVSGLDFPRGVVVSNDGNQVYVVGSGLATFARNPTTGALTFLQVLTTVNVGGYPLGDLEISPGGEHVYAGGVQLARDAGTGLLSYVANNFVFAAATKLNAAGDRMFGLAEFGGTVDVYDRNVVTGALTFLETVDLGDRSGNELTTDPTGTVAVYATMDDTITPVVEVGGSFVAGDDARAGGGVTGLWDASGVVVSPDGAHVYACGPRDDAIAIFARNSGTGSLTLLGSVEQGVAGAAGLDGVRHLSISPDGATVYASALDINTNDWSLSAYTRDPGTGALTFLETEPDAGLSVVSPDGRHVYVRQGIYERDLGTGGLTWIASTLFFGPYFFPLTFSADGLYAYAPGSDLEAWARNPITGLLTSIDQEAGGLGGVPEDFEVDDLVASSDGRRIFVATHADPTEGAVYVFDRDPATGTLAFRNVAHEGPTDVLARIPGDAMLLAGKDFSFFYPSIADEVVALGYNPVKATLVTAQVPEGFTGREEPDRTLALAVSPDGTSVYAASPDGDALRVLRVNTCAPAVTSTKVVLKQIAPEPNPANEGLVLKGLSSLRGEPFASLDLVTTGARVLVERADGSTAADVAIPAGAYAGAGTAGWRLNAAGTVWTYLDKTATPPNGIKKIVVKDHSVKVPGHVKLKVASAPLGSYPVTSSDLPIAVTLELGNAMPCSRTGFSSDDCVFRPTGSAVCKSS